MPARHSFDYAILRLVPCLERGEFVNVGVVFYCKGRNFLEARIHLDEPRLRALWPKLDLELVRERLAAFPNVCAGGPDSGPIGRLSQRERFHWLVAPRSTIIQVSAVHSGLCEEPSQTFDELFARLVR